MSRARTTLQLPHSAAHRRIRLNALQLAAAALALAASAQAGAAISCARTLRADVVALDTPMMFNRLGAQNINWMVYALAEDVVKLNNTPVLGAGGVVDAPRGMVKVRPDKRIRPLVLRIAAGDCLRVSLYNALAPQANPFNLNPRVDPGQVDANSQIGNAAPRFTVFPISDDQPADRHVSFTVNGLQLVNDINDSSTYVGRNANSMAPNGAGPKTYVLYGEKEGVFPIQNHGAYFGSDATSGTNSQGLFGQVIVEAKGASIYRNQVTEEDLRLATRTTVDRRGTVTVLRTPQGHPILDYEAVYPNQEPWISEGRAGLPVLNKLKGTKIVHSEVDAVIAYDANGDGRFDGDGKFPAGTYPIEGTGATNPAYPNRLEPYRSFAQVWHDENTVSQAFPQWYLDPVLGHTLHITRDSFMINYGSGGIGSEIIANRLGVGPMHDCLSCAYEEFFLTSYTVGDPAMVVDVPANFGLENCTPALGADCAAVGPKATQALFPSDPANVNHAYVGDFVKFRNTHSGKEQHVFHLHNHQWLFNPNDDNSNYLDAQGIGPGSGYTYEIANGGSGNRNKSAGDAIFHCHFYPHFAQGMWYLYRIHDVYETGTLLAASSGGTNQTVSVNGKPGSFHRNPFALRNGLPAAGARALPDGEIVAGTPIPATVPLPGKGLPPMPGKVTVVPKVAQKPVIDPATGQQVVDRRGRPQVQQVTVGSNAKVDRTDLAAGKNPGYPFWVGGIEDVVGQRPPTPPLDMATKTDMAALKAGNPTLFGQVDRTGTAEGFDGGLPRFALQGVADGGAVAHVGLSRLDLSKVVVRAKPVFFPEQGTDVEQAAMKFHATRSHSSSAFGAGGAVLANRPFVVNGAPPVAGAPFSDPCIDDRGNSTSTSLGYYNDASGGQGFTGASPFNSNDPRVYKAAQVQLDAVLNKVGYHYPQQRIEALWEDVNALINKQKAPEPFVMRMNTFDCAMFAHSNLYPAEFELDDYQVRTPTDIVGQHIHLPKWDLTTADGAANGWNYEDGTLGPGAVRERIEAINHFNEQFPLMAVATLPRPDGTGGGLRHLSPKPHPFLGAGVANEWLGARVTLQRWFADPLVNIEGVDRGLGIIFTHDHYGPSTHQQIGLYNTLLIEPAGSKWVHNETGQAMYTRADGGPTSWQAAILPGQNGYGGSILAETNKVVAPFREFYLEYSDFQSAYQPGVYVGAGPDGRPHDGVNAPAWFLANEGREANPLFPTSPTSFQDAINPSYRQQLAGGGNPFPDTMRHPPFCPGDVPRPCPEAISGDDPGMMSVNYRNEPLALRVFDPNAIGPDGKRGMQAAGTGGDLAYALQSRRDRAIPEMNNQPAAGQVAPSNAVSQGTKKLPTAFPPPINAAGVGPGDPFTPMMRAYSGDIVRVKSQAGGHEHEHNIAVHGVKWMQGGSGHGRAPNSGWRGAQSQGISEQMTLAVPIVPAEQARGTERDYLWAVDNSSDGFWAGMWGLLRTYDRPQGDLYELPNSVVPLNIGNIAGFRGVCPTTAPVRAVSVTAVLANDILRNRTGATIPANVNPLDNVGGPLNPAGGTLVYNPRPQQIRPLFVPDGGFQLGGQSGPLHDPTAILYVRTEDMANPNDPKAGLKPGAPVEPLVLRANAGECVNVTLRNRLPATAMPDLAGWFQMLQVVRRNVEPDGSVTWFNNNLIRASNQVGLAPQLVAYDVTRAAGMNIGDNPPATVAPGMEQGFTWWVGDLHYDRVSLATKDIMLDARPVEFGASNLRPADVIKQGQKGLFGALAVEPAQSAWNDSLAALESTYDHQVYPVADGMKTRAQMNVTRAAAGGQLRSLVPVVQKAINFRWKDGSAVANLSAEGLGFPEDSHDGGQQAMNYGAEPLWFRFGLPPDAPFGKEGFGGIANAHQAFSNNCCDNGGTATTALKGVGEPATPVFTAPKGRETLVRLTYPFGVGRGSTIAINGHVWQRDPYVCPLESRLGLQGLCTLATEVGSQAIGHNPIGFYEGARESMQPMSHYDIRLPSAGGGNGVAGDYLIVDQASFGRTQGLWGILRVQ